jgi:GDP-mannose 6-dehydrogenase
MRIAVFGLGYVGTVAAACLARDGHTVTGVDPNTTKVDLINGGKSPIIESDIGELIDSAVSSGRLSATADAGRAVSQCELSLVCVGTPSRANGSLDTKYVQAVCREIGAAIYKKGKGSRHTVAIRSTLLPGTMRGIVIPSLESSSHMKAGGDFGLCHNPEFLREGSAVYDYDNPPKTVIGQIDSASGDALIEIYKSIEAPAFRTSLGEAEMVKYVDNVWHALKICFANEIGNISKEAGLNSCRIMEIFCQDVKLNISSAYLRPGFAFGGSCLPKDVRALTYHARSRDVTVPVLDAIMSTIMPGALDSLVSVSRKELTT